MIASLVLVVLGIYALVQGSRYLVAGSSSIARNFGVPSLIIGLTIVSFGTSLPELVINVAAAIHGTPGVAVGNIVGSNIANILLILGMSACVHELFISKSTIKKELPFMLFVMFLLVVFVGGNSGSASVASISRLEGVVLLGFFGLYILYLFRSARKSTVVVMANIAGEDRISRKCSVIYVLGGLCMLIVGGKAVVEGAIAIARVLSLSESVIGLTVIAVGTSLPELVTSIIATRRGEYDLAVGNVVGSNIFNSLFILGITALITPLPITSDSSVDMMVAFILSLVMFMLILGKKNTLRRWHGVVFVLLYISYITFSLIG